MPAGLLDLLGSTDRDLVLRGSNRVAYAAGFVTYRGVGSPPFGLIVESGLVRLFVQSEDGRQASIAYLHPGDIYAADRIIPAGLANVQALEESLLLMIDPGNLFRLAAENLAIAEAIIRIAGDVIRHLERIITVRSLGSLTERLAFDLLERAGGTQLREGELVCRATHEQLADSIGSTREVVTRIIGDLRRLRIVETSPGRVRVLDATRLSRIVEGLLTA